MLGPCKHHPADRLVPISLEAAVPADHFYRHLDATLDLSFVRDWVRDLYADRGRPSIDPVVFFKLQLVMFFEGVRSERQLMRVVADRLSVRWYLRYDLDESLPDHSSLTRIRNRLGLPIFQRFFAHVVDLCQQAGLVWGRELFFDSTRVRANADIDSLVPRWYLRAKAHLDDLFTGDAPAPPPTDGAPVASDVPADGLPVGALARVPFTADPVVEAQLTATNQARWPVLERLRLDPARPTTRGYRRTSDEWESLTDPDAASMRSGAGGLAVLGYHDHFHEKAGSGQAGSDLRPTSPNA
jgi:transposase